jgi:hypothetical protein
MIIRHRFSPALGRLVAIDLSATADLSADAERLLWRRPQGRHIILRNATEPGSA